MHNTSINLVVLGSFNPAILTHEFLTQECGLDIVGEPTSQSLGVPVVATLEYDSLSFFADLGRLQIVEKNCLDPRSSRIPGYLKKYLEKLPYTPLSKCGANINCNLEVEPIKLKSLGQWLKKDRQKFCEIMKVESVELDVSFITGKEEESIKSCVLSTSLAEYNACTKMKISEINNTSIKIDFNYEVAGLGADKNLLKSVTDEYKHVVDIFNEQINRIFSELDL